MTFPLAPASPFVPFTTKLTSATLNAWRVAINEALDGTAGGTYAPSAQLVIGGAGLKLTGATALELSATSVSTLDAGGVLDVNGQVNVGPDAVVSFVGTTFNTALLSIGANGELLVAGSGLLSVDGGVAQIMPAGVLNIYGVETVEPAGVVQWSGTNPASSGHYAAAKWNQYSTAEWFSGSFLTTDVGSVVQLGGSVTAPSGAGNTVNLAGTNTFSGTNALSGPTTQTALYTRSGSGGRTALRTTTLNSDTNLNVDPSQWDFIEIDASGFTTDRAWTFLAPPGGICCPVFLKANTSSSWNHGLTINAGTGVGGTTLLTFTSGGGGTFTGSQIIIYDPVLGVWRGVGAPTLFNA